MQNIQIKNSEGNQSVNFDGKVWEIYLDDEDGVTLDHSIVADSPYYLFNYLEQFEDSEAIIKELSEKSDELKTLFENYFKEQSKLENRTILFESEDAGFTSSFSDLLVFYGDEKNGYTVETNVISDAWEDSGYPTVNALGESVDEEVSGIFDARELYRAIKTVIETNPRWKEIKWTWDDIIKNLKDSYPDLAAELKQIVSDEAK